MAWLDAPASNGRWQKLRPFLEYLNFPTYHFHMALAVYRREIEKFPLDNNGLAGHLQKPYNNINEESEFAGLMRAMHFAKDKGASLHMTNASHAPLGRRAAPPYEDR